MAKKEVASDADPSFVIFFDVNMPKTPLRELLSCLEPHARLSFLNGINYFARRDVLFEQLKRKFFSGKETQPTSDMFRAVKIIAPSRMKDPVLYLYVGMLTDALYKDARCFFLTCDRKFETEIQREFEKPEHRRIRPKDIPIKSFGQHNTKVLHQRIARQIIQWFSCVSGIPLEPSF